MTIRLPGNDTPAPRRSGVRPRSPGPVGGLQAFTLIELLVVILIMSIVASLVVGLSSVASRKSKESRIRTELNQLITALENYKARYGFYPPDNAIGSGASLTVNPVTNQLFYELTGTSYEPTSGKREFTSRNAKISASAIQSFFHRDGFVNMTLVPPDPDGPKNAKNFLPNLKASQVRRISDADNVEVLAVPVDWPPNHPEPPLKGIGDTVVRRINPWRYVSTSPTNNSTAFDLWAEFVLGGKIIRISNWERDPVVVKP